MSYTPEMRVSIQRVATTRLQRLNQTWPMMSPAEKQEILQKFHPDYKPEGMRELRVGHQKGIRMPLELADVMESYSHLTADALDLLSVDIETDVLIIGGGGAGSAAALLARQHGAQVVMATKLRHGDANTMMAQG
ncbi:MAG: FAD-binding protein, partial [Anaerolineae bacterium]